MEPSADRPHGARTVAGGALTYFALVFGCGFLLGVVRVLWLVPLLGVRWAELLEMPVMVAVMVLAARWVSRRFALGGRPPSASLAVGAGALALLVAAELALAAGLSGLTLGGYIASRDPISGAAYLVSLLLYAAMPVLVRRRGGGP